MRILYLEAVMHMIRKAERADLPECVMVIRNSFQTVADEFGFTEENAPRFTAFATTEDRLAWQMYIEHRLMYVDEEDGRICGYYSLRLNGDGTCDLGSLSVLPEYRHRGIGGTLLKHSAEVARAQRCSVMKLGIVEENTILRKWYERNGAVHTGTEKFDFFPFTCGYMEIDLQKQGTEMEPLINRFTALSEEILKDNLTGIYLHGSAVMGCWQPKKSDLDFIVVVERPMTDADKREYIDKLVELDAEGPAKGIEMSIVTRNVCNPFIYPTPFILHYSRMHNGWYWKDPEDYIRKMNGTDRDLAAHFTVIRSRGRCLYGLPVSELFGEVPEQDYLDSIWYDISGAKEEIEEQPMYLILNLARVLAYLKEKEVLSKKEGGEWGLRNLPERYHPLIRSALREYEDGEDVRYDRDLATDYADYMLRQISPGMKQE